MKPWYSICVPHKDIREGRLDEATFAVDLWGVVTGNGPEVYLNPEEFFKKTFPTDGLKKVISKTIKGLAGSAEVGDRILSLQTSFGGGKTHLLLALYHLAKSAGRVDSLKRLLDETGASLPGIKINVAVFTNKTCDATQGRLTNDGIRIHTMWGEIAYQLGGKEAYALIAANDVSKTAPQGLFENLLRKYAPCIILVDELTDYCVTASGAKVGETTLARQTISFTQQLTQAVGLVTGSMLVATLPTSDPSIAGGEIGLGILSELEQRFERMAADQLPVQDHEIFEVVRRRLFDSIGDSSELRSVANAFIDLYKDHQTELPLEASKVGYRDLIERSYPFHPTLIDSLYKRWGSHNDFQRTRGVLRLLGVLVADLWHRKNNSTQSQSLIQPRHVSWSLDAWASNLTRLWGNGYQAVMAADVVSENANAVVLDRERAGDYEREKISEGVASAILLGSFGAQADHAGLNEKEIKLAAAHPGLNWNYVDGAIVGLEQRSFYLHTTSGAEKRYWFNTKPTINQLIVRYRASLSSQSFDGQIEEAIKKQASSLSINWKVLVNPGFDLAEQRSLTLVVLPPTVSWSDAEPGQKTAKETILRISRFCGSRERLFRNTLLYLMVTHTGARALQKAYLEVNALETVIRDYGSQIDGEQRSELKERIELAKKQAEESLSASFVVLSKVTKDDVVTDAVTEPRSSLKTYFDALWRHVIERDWVHQKIGPVEFSNSGLIPKESGVRVKDAVESFLRYTDKPIVPNSQVVQSAIQAAIQDGRVGLGQGISLNNLQKKWCKESAFVSWDEDGLWIIPPFEKVQVQATTPSGVGNAPSTGPSPNPEPLPSLTSPSIPQPSIKKIVIKGSVSLENWGEVFRSFIQPSTQMSLKKQKLSIEFEFEARDTQPIAEDNRFKAMKEAANQLGLKMESET